MYKHVFVDSELWQLNIYNLNLLKPYCFLLMDLEIKKNATRRRVNLPVLLMCPRSWAAVVALCRPQGAAASAPPLGQRAKPVVGAGRPPPWAWTPALTCRRHRRRAADWAPAER